MADITKLKQSGIHTISAVVMTTRRNLAKIKGFSEAKVGRRLLSVPYAHADFDPDRKDQGSCLEASGQKIFVGVLGRRLTSLPAHRQLPERMRGCPVSQACPIDLDRQQGVRRHACRRHHDHEHHRSLWRVSLRQDPARSHHVSPSFVRIESRELTVEVHHHATAAITRWCGGQGRLYRYRRHFPTRGIALSPSLGMRGRWTDEAALPCDRGTIRRRCGPGDGEHRLQSMLVRESLRSLRAS